MQIAEFWTALQERVDTPTMQQALGGRGRVYRPADGVPDAEADAGTPWGRIVMITRSALWPTAEEPGEAAKGAWLMAVQFNDFKARGYDVDIPIRAAHEELYRRLDNFAPALERALVYVPVYRFSQPPVAAVYDGSRRLWLSNAEYRAQLTSPVEV